MTTRVYLAVGMLFLDCSCSSNGMLSDSLAQDSTGGWADSYRTSLPGPSHLPLFDLRKRCLPSPACRRAQVVESATGADSSSTSAARGHGAVVSSERPSTCTRAQREENATEPSSVSTSAAVRNGHWAATVSHAMHAACEHRASSNAISPRGGSSWEEADTLDASLYAAGSNAAEAGTASSGGIGSATVVSEAAVGSNAAEWGTAGSEHAGSDTVVSEGTASGVIVPSIIDRHLTDLRRKASSDHDADPAYMNDIESEHDDDEDDDDNVSVRSGVSSDVDHSDGIAGSPHSHHRSVRLPRARTEPLVQYEIERMDNIRRNNEMLESLGIIEAKVAIRPAETTEQSKRTHRTSWRTLTTDCCHRQTRLPYRRRKATENSASAAPWQASKGAGGRSRLQQTIS